MCDGWEHAGAYHYMMMQLSEGSFSMVLPGVSQDGVHPLLWVCPMTTDLLRLADPDPRHRMIGHVGFAKAAYELAHEVLGCDQGSPE